MGRIVVVAYRPTPGREADLDRLVREHVPRLRSFGLVTERAPVLMKAGDGTVLEVFEWLSTDAIDQAHSHPGVGRMWAEFGEVCEYLPAGAVPEMSRPFSDFEPM